MVIIVIMQRVRGADSGKYLTGETTLTVTHSRQLHHHHHHCSQRDHRSHCRHHSHRSIILIVIIIMLTISIEDGKNLEKRGLPPASSSSCRSSRRDYASSQAPHRSVISTQNLQNFVSFDFLSLNYNRLQ